MTQKMIEKILLMVYRKMKTSYLCTTEIEQDDRFGAFKKNAALFRIESHSDKYKNKFYFLFR